MNSDKQQVLELHLPVEVDGQLPIELLGKHCALGNNALKQAADRGALWLTRIDQTGNSHTRRLRRIKTSLNTSDTLHLYYNSRVLADNVEPATMLADEGSYSIWNKPAGMLCQGSKWSDHCTILRRAEKQLQKSLYIVHRLDRATNGLVLLAHSKHSARVLARLFENRQIEKEYRANVHGQFPDFIEPLVIDAPIDGKPAISHIWIERVDRKNSRSLLRVSIKTGRKHQIRRHLSDYGFPIIGDRRYGKEGDNGDLRLQAYRLAFICPETGEAREYKLD